MANRKKSLRKQAPQARSEISTPFVLPLGALAGAVVIAVVTFIAYLPSISGGFILDDDELLTDNHFIKTSDGLYRFWCTTETMDYWPVTNTSLWLEWRLWGMNPTGYHVTNLILHVLESLLIWLILRKLSIPGAFLAAMVFAVHPVNVESVAWIAQRKNTMAMLFFLLSILWYLTSEKKTGPEGSANKLDLFPFPWYWLSLVAFLLAMLSKGSVAVLPVLLLGIVWWLRPLTGRDLLRIAPFFLIAAVLAGVNVWFQTHGKEIVVRTAGFADRLLEAGGVIWFYLYKAILPVDLAFVYPQWHIEAGNPLWWLPLLAAVAVTAVLWSSRKGWARPFLFAWGFFCVALTPVMGFVDVGFMKYSLVADRYQHIAIIGVIALAAAGWSIWRHQARRATRWAATIVTFGAVGVLAFLTWQQNRIYRDAITLYQATLEKNPGCWMAHNNLGYTLVHAGQPQEAINHCEKAIRLKPDYADAYNNLGYALLQAGRLNEACEYCKRALRLMSNFPEAHNNLAIILAQTGRQQEAIKHSKQALRLKPDFPEALNNLGIILAQTGRPAEAIEHYEQALRLNPDLPDTHYNLGNVLLETGRLPEAIEQYEIVLRLKPDFIDAHNNLGALLVQLGRFNESIEHLRQVLQFRPKQISACFNLAKAYAGTRQAAEAVAAAQKALELARSEGQTALAKRMEDWLNSYKAGLSEQPSASPSRESGSQRQ